MVGIVPPYSLWLPLRGVRPANKIKNVETLHILFRLKSSSIIWRAFTHLGKSITVLYAIRFESQASESLVLDTQDCVPHSRFLLCTSHNLELMIRSLPLDVIGLAVLVACPR